MAVRLYILRVLVAGDRFVNVVLGGKLDETLSASAWYGEQQNKIFPRIFRPVIDFIFLMLARESDHCRKQYEYEYERYERPRP